MTNFQKIILARAMSIALAGVLGGCLHDDDDDKKKVDDVPIEPQSTTLNGTIVKGIFKFASVNIYSVIDGVVSTDPIATATTDANGQYSVEVNYQGPILVKSSAKDANSVMVCDIPSGCDDGMGGTVAFGADADIPDNLELTAVSISGGNAISINVTPLTHIAAEIAAASGSLSATKIAEANSKVAALFNLTGSLTEFPAIDITDPAALAAADDEAASNALIAAATYSAVLNEGIELSDLAESISNDGIVADAGTGGAGIVDLKEIYEQADIILQEDVYVNSTVDLSDIQSEVDSAVILAENIGDVVVDIHPVSDAAAADIEKALMMIADIRNLGTSLMLEQKATTFADEMEIAGDLLNADVDAVATAMGYAMQAIIDTRAVIKDEGTTTTSTTHMVTMVEEVYNPETMMDEEVDIMYQGSSVTVTVTFDSMNNYSVDQSITGVTVDFTAMIDVAIADTSEEVGNVRTETTVFDESFTLSGTASNAYVSLAITAGSASVDANIVSIRTETVINEGFQDEWDEEFTGITITFDLAATLTQTAMVSGEDEMGVAISTSGNTLSGDFSFALTNANADLLETETDAMNCIDGSSAPMNCTSSSSVDFETASISFNGSMSDGESTISAVISFNAAGHGYTHTVDESDCLIVTTNCEEEVASEETAEAFLSGSFNLNLTLALAGISDETRVTLTGSRDGLNSAEVGAEIAYDGKRYDISAPIIRTMGTGGAEDEVSTTVTITNHNNVVMVLMEVDDVLSGTLSVGTTQYATIDESVGGITLVRFENGIIESLE